MVVSQDMGDSEEKRKRLRPWLRRKRRRRKKMKGQGKKSSSCIITDWRSCPVDSRGGSQTLRDRY
jgi:hypothetical protein